MLELGNSLTALAAEAFIISCNDRNALTRIRNKIYFLCKFVLSCFLIFSAFIWLLVVGSRRDPGPLDNYGFPKVSLFYGNRQCEFRFPQFGSRMRGGTDYSNS